MAIAERVGALLSDSKPAPRQAYDGFVIVSLNAGPGSKQPATLSSFLACVGRYAFLTEVFPGSGRGGEMGDAFKFSW